MLTDNCHVGSKEGTKKHNEDDKEDGETATNIGQGVTESYEDD